MIFFRNVGSGSDTPTISIHLQKAHMSVKHPKPKIINGYHIELPPFKLPVEHRAVTYFHSHSKLFSVGGEYGGETLKTIHELKLHCNVFKKMKWRSIGKKLKRARFQTSLCNLDIEQKFAIIGGKKDFRPLRHCEIYNLPLKRSIAIAQLNEERSNCATCFIPDTRQIIVGGGVMFGDAMNTIEIYDCVKNKWQLHPSKTVHRHSYPTIWNDVLNPSIIYIAGDSIGIGTGGRNANLGYVEWIDLRDRASNARWNVMFDRPIDRLWRFKLSKARAWESRALFVL